MEKDKEKAMAFITINGKDIRNFMEQFSIKLAKMEMALDTLARDVELLRKQMFEKQAENGKQDVDLAQLKSTCDYRGKIVDELIQFKNKFLFIQIAGNVLTLGVVFLIFRLLGK